MYSIGGAQAMDVLNATDVRKNWSETLDSVVHEKPVYIKRTRDEISMVDIRLLNYLLFIYKYRVEKSIESDGSVTLSAVDMDLVVNGLSEDDALDKMVIEIKTYANDYYDEFDLWSKAPNRKSHIPYVLKALSLNDSEIRRDIECLNGKN